MSGNAAIGRRQLKRVVSGLLSADNIRAAMVKIEALPNRRVINILISLFCDGDPLIRWRAIMVAGRIVAALGEYDREQARVIMRRFMWMLNDESGGIGWGVPEAMGETMARSRWLADEYAAILCSYVHPERNFLEHPVLQQGVLWALGRLAQTRPGLVRNTVADLLPFLESADPVHRGYASWAAGYMRSRRTLAALHRLRGDDTRVSLFQNGFLLTETVGHLATASISKISEKNDGTG